MPKQKQGYRLKKPQDDLRSKAPKENKEILRFREVFNESHSGVFKR